MIERPRSEFSMHVREMLQHWRVIGLSALLVGSLLFGLISARPQESVASATLRVSLPEGSGDDGTITEFQTRSLAELALTTATIDAVIAESGSAGSVSEIRSRITIELKDTPGFLVVTGRETTPARAAALANTMASVLVAESEVDPGGSANGKIVQLIEPADAADATTRGGTGSAVAAGIVAAMAAAILIGEGLVAARLLGGRFSPVDPGQELQRLSGAPVLDLREPATPGLLLPFFIEHLGARPVLTVMQIGEGPSVDVACRLAKASGDVHRRVLLVDGDGGRSLLHRAVGQESIPGAAEVAKGELTLKSAVRPAGGDIRAAVLTAGRSTPGDPVGAQLLPAMQHMLRESGAEQVVVSSTSASSLDELLLVAHTFPDAIVLTLDPSQLSARAVRRVLAQLHAVEATVVGVVITGSTTKPSVW
jgi:Mrp family chromosome partitioning ATPase